MKKFSQHAYDRDWELALIENFMREGVNDPGIFKAFFNCLPKSWDSCHYYWPYLR